MSFRRPAALGFGLLALAALGLYPRVSAAGAPPPTSRPAAPFTFAIIGDRTGGANHKIFLQVIEQIRRSRPDLVINVGDLIEGYNEQRQVISAEWKQIMGALRVLSPAPVRLVPGNHDIFGPVSQRLWRTFTGRNRFYSFDFRGSHFVVLDNSRAAPWNELDAPQRRWLVADLQSHRNATNIFVFYHKPTFYWRLAGRKAPLHELFRRYGVRRVFNGHFHGYSSVKLDGITYHQVGSSGGHIRKVKLNTGYFYHHVRVRVAGKRQTVTIVRHQGTLPANHVSARRAFKRIELARSGFDLQPFLLERIADPVERQIKLTIRNPERGRLVGLAQFKGRSGVWSVQPARVEVDLPQGGRRTVRLRVRLQRPKRWWPPPKLVFARKAPARAGVKGRGAHPPRVKVRLPIRRSIQVRRRATPKVKLDGRLDEPAWLGATAVDPFPSAAQKDGTVHATRLLLMHDGRTLHIGIRNGDLTMKIPKPVFTRRDSTVYRDDHIWIFLKPPGSGPDYYQLIANSAGAIFDRRCRAASHWLFGHVVRDLGWNGSWRAASTRDRWGWTAELAVPLRKALGAPWKPGIRLGFNLHRYQKSTRGRATFNPPMRHDPKTFGELVLE